MEAKTEQPTVKTQHRIIPIVLIGFGFPIALIIGFLLVVNIFFHDEQPPNDSALVVANILVPDAKNAYLDVQRMNTNLIALDPQATQPRTDTRVDDLLNGGTWDQTYVNTALKKYALPISDFHLAAKKELYQGPQGAHPNALDPNSFPTGISDVRFVAKLVALEGLSTAKQKGGPIGLEQAMDIVRLSHLMESGQQTLIEWLVGSATQQIGLSALRRIAVQTTLTAEQVRPIITELDLYSNTTAGLVSAMKMEYAYAKSYQKLYAHLGILYDQFFLTDGGSAYRSVTGRFISFLDDLGVTRFYYWPNQNWRFMVEEKEQLVALAQTDCVSGNFSPLLPQRSHRTGVGRLFEPNAAGKLIADIGRVSLSGIVEKRCNETLSVAATQAVLAVVAWQHDRGGLLGSLADIVPTYHEHIPFDPYSGNPLKYLAAKKIVYSVGPSHTDIGGSPMNADWQKEKNPSFALQ